MFLESGVLIAGALMILIGSIWMIVCQFRTAWYWGIFGILMPLVHILYLVVHTKRAIGPWLIILVGGAFTFLTADKVINQSIANDTFNWSEFREQQRYIWLERSSHIKAPLLDYVGLDGYCDIAINNRYIEPDYQQYPQWSLRPFSRYGFATHLPGPPKVAPLNEKTSVKAINVADNTLKPMLAIDYWASKASLPLYQITVFSFATPVEFYESFKQSLLELNQQAIAARPNHTVTASKRLCLNGAPGIELNFQPPNQTTREKLQIYLVNNQVYQIHTIARTSQYDDLLRFHRSFQLLDSLNKKPENFAANNQLLKQPLADTSNPPQSTLAKATEADAELPQATVDANDDSTYSFEQSAVSLNLVELDKALGQRLKVIEKSGISREGFLVELRKSSLVLEQNTQLAGQIGSGSVQYIMRFRNIEQIQIIGN